VESRLRDTAACDAKKAAAREQGFVLLVVLWVLTSAVLLVASYNAAVRSGAASTVSEIGQSKSDALVDAGLEIAAAHLLDKNEKRRWLGDGSQHRMMFDGAELTISVRDASGLIDLNKSNGKLLRAFFLKFTKSMAKSALYADIILKAREAVEKEKNPDAGKPESNDTDYRRTSAAAAFIDVWQFGRTPGIPRDLFDEVAPYLTVYSGDGTIYSATAPIKVLEAIPDLNQADIEKIRYVNKAALVDLMAKAPDYLTFENGPARLVTVRVRLPEASESIVKTFVIAIGIDSAAPYRLLAKQPATYIAEDGQN
jgi:general secretion pathway protein K